MKKILSIVILLLSGIGAWAEDTNDYIKISEATLVPGGAEVCVTVSLEGTENFYSGYNMDIHLPDGIELNYYKGAPDVSLVKTGGILPFEEDRDGTTYFHQLSCSYGVVGRGIIRIAVISTSNKAFTAKGGDLLKMYIKATPYAKPGNADIEIDGVALKVAGGAQYDPVPGVDNNVRVSASSTLPLNINPTNHWSTCILPFDAQIPAGVKAYTVGGHDSENLLLSEAGSFAAYTPYILYSESGYSGNVSGTVDPNQYPATGVVNTDGYLNGAIVAQNVTSGYVMQNLSEGVKFYQITSGTFNVPAGKCWMTLPAGGPVKGLGFVVEDESAIEQIKTPDSHIIYNLAGQQVQNPQKGIYIVNGKKVMY